MTPPPPPHVSRTLFISRQQRRGTGAMVNCRVVALTVLTLLFLQLTESAYTGEGLAGGGPVGAGGPVGEAGSARDVGCVSPLCSKGVIATEEYAQHIEKIRERRLQEVLDEIWKRLNKSNTVPPIIRFNISSGVPANPSIPLPKTTVSAPTLNVDDGVVAGGTRNVEEEASTEYVIYMYPHQVRPSTSNTSVSSTLEFVRESRFPLEVTNAQLNILIKYPNQRKGEPNPSQSVTLRVYQHHPDSDMADTLLSSFSTAIRHTKWQKLMLPTTALQHLIDNRDKGASRTLHLRVDCAQCKPGVLWPVMQYKKKKTKRSSKHRKRDSLAVTTRRQRDQESAGDVTEGSTTENNERSQNSRKQRSSTAVANSKKQRRMRQRSQRKRKKNNQQDKMNKRRPFIMVIAHSKAEAGAERYERKITRREKRHNEECSVSKVGHHCSKKRMYVSFKELGWDSWILKPAGYWANYCDGKCPNFHRSQHYAELDKSNENMAYGQTCCRPTKMKPLQLLYMDDDGNIIKTTISDMIVDKCGCA